MWWSGAHYLCGAMGGFLVGLFILALRSNGLIQVAFGKYILLIGDLSFLPRSPKVLTCTSYRPRRSRLCRQLLRSPPTRHRPLRHGVCREHGVGTRYRLFHQRQPQGVLHLQRRDLRPSTPTLVRTSSECCARSPLTIFLLSPLPFVLSALPSTLPPPSISLTQLPSRSNSEF